jgi:hypothetical protein
LFQDGKAFDFSDGRQLHSVLVGELYSVSCTLFGWRALAQVDLFTVVVVAEHEDMTL